MRKLTVAGLVLAGWAGPAFAATHTVVKGDHLWGLAGHYYGNSFRWKVIYAANQDKIKDPHWIYPGQVFEIPEVPGPEIGELPARPVEKEAQAVVETPAAAPQEAEAQAPVAEAAPVKAAEPAAPQKPRFRTDDLSVEMPEGLAGQYPSMIREKVDREWSADGKITEFEGRETMAGQGDFVAGKLDDGFSVGDKLTIYRPAGAQELDNDPNARYVQKMGVVQVKKDLGKRHYRFVILKSGDSVQVGDLLKRMW